MVVGITGGIGSGKSTFAKLLNKHLENSILLMTDDIAKKLQEVGKESYFAIVKEFGFEILNEDKTINSKKLGEIVFKDEEKLNKLNKITHPNVINYVKNVIKENKKENKIILIESAILCQCELKKLCNEIIYVKTSKECREKWLIEKRGYTKEKINNILNYQHIDNIDRTMCIMNDYSLEDLERKSIFVKEYLEETIYKNKKRH